MCCCRAGSVQELDHRIGKYFSFSGFSVGFCINEEKRLSVTNYSSENDLPTFRLNASVIKRTNY